jgi:hypothetical protein
MNISLWKVLAVSAAGLALSVTPSFADWTYTAPGTMTGTQDFTSSVSPNTYAMGNASLNATLNVQSGTLTLTADQFVLGNAALATINATGGTLNIINTYWGTTIGQHIEAAGSSVNISGGATVNWDITSQGWSQQRLYIANGPYNPASASVNLNGGTFAVTSANSGDSGRGVYVGAGGNNSVGTINLNTGTFSVAGAIPFGLGGDFGNTLSATATWTSGNGISKMNITDGIFMQTGFTLATGLSSTASTFMIGGTSYVNFISGGTGYLSLEGWDQSSFDALVTAGQIKLDGATALTSDFSFSTNGDQGTYRLAVPEPSTAMFLMGGVGVLALLRRRNVKA